MSEYEFTSDNGTGDPTWPSDGKYDNPHPIQNISPRTLEMIDRGMENLKKGNVSEPIDMEQDFPGLFDEE